MNILLIEDDPLFGQGLKLNLKERGYRVDWLQDGCRGLAAIQDTNAELVILDLNLPGMDGMQVLKKARRHGHDIPILILTARDAIEHRLGGLNNGADDYLLKPFELDELDARLHALYRRAHGRSSESLQHGDIRIHTGRREVSVHDEIIPFSRREYDLLMLLLDNRGQVMTRRRLLEQLYEDDPQSNALEVHIHHLRKKLGKSLIKTIRGVGYLVES